MQVVEKLNEGLSRVLEVTIAKGELTQKLDAKIAEIAPKMNIKGFRPGKVPAAHVRKMYGKELMGEIIQETLNETTQKAMKDAKIRPASQPELKPIGDMEGVIDGKSDLAYEIAVEVMPNFTPVEPDHDRTDAPGLRADRRRNRRGPEDLCQAKAITKPRPASPSRPPTATS